MLEHDMYKSEHPTTEDESSVVPTVETYFENMPDNNKIQIKNQLGEFEFSADQSLMFENGLVGFQDVKQFGLGNLPYDNMEQFKLLQSLEVPELSFIVLPMGAEGSALEDSDVEELMSTFGISKENLALLFIVTIRNMGESIKMTMNLRAPIILDMSRRTGRQFILPNQKYSVQHEL